MGVGANHGVVEVGVRGRERIKDEASVGEVAGGGESGKSEELGEVCWVWEW